MSSKMPEQNIKGAGERDGGGYQNKLVTRMHVVCLHHSERFTNTQQKEDTITTHTDRAQSESGHLVVGPCGVIKRFENIIEILLCSPCAVGDGFEI